MLIYSTHYNENSNQWQLIERKDNFDLIVDEFETYGECIAEANTLCHLNDGIFDRYGSDLLQKV